MTQANQAITDRLSGPGHRSDFDNPVFDSRLSYQARGILQYIQHYPRRRRFSVASLYAGGKAHRDSEPAVRHAVKELAAYGYVNHKNGYISLSIDHERDRASLGDQNSNLKY